MVEASIQMGILRGTNQVFVLLLCLQNERDRRGPYVPSLIPYRDFVRLLIRFSFFNFIF